MYAEQNAACNLPFNTVHVGNCYDSQCFCRMSKYMKLKIMNCHIRKMWDYLHWFKNLFGYFGWRSWQWILCFQPKTLFRLWVERICSQLFLFSGVCFLFKSVKAEYIHNLSHSGICCPLAQNCCLPRHLSYFFDAHEQAKHHTTWLTSPALYVWQLHSSAHCSSRT